MKLAVVHSEGLVQDPIFEIAITLIQIIVDSIVPRFSRRGKVRLQTRLPHIPEECYGLN